MAVSLAKVYIKPDGDQVEYILFAIYDGEQMVGFIMHAFEENTSDMYWINGFLIDEKYQGKGYEKGSFKGNNPLDFKSIFTMQRNPINCLSR